MTIPDKDDDGHPIGWEFVAIPECVQRSVAAQMQNAFAWGPGGMASVARPLLKSLDDSDRAVAAGVLLRRISGKGPSQSVERIGDAITVYYDGVLPVRFHKSELRPGDGPLVAAAIADPSSWRSLRDRWHDRLDIQVFSVAYAWPVMVTTLLPLLWLLRFTKRRKPGSCQVCGYSLTGNTSGVCPECGTPVIWTAEAKA